MRSHSIYFDEEICFMVVNILRAMLNCDDDSTRIDTLCLQSTTQRYLALNF